ncbi:MAG: hypothetical protein FJX72_08255 [Armatimonadetes bacterium]|nr:hypothetical protein [Armatimonadota bacterium]
MDTSVAPAAAAVGPSHKRPKPAQKVLARRRFPGLAHARMRRFMMHSVGEDTMSLLVKRRRAKLRALLVFSQLFVPLLAWASARYMGPGVERLLRDTYVNEIVECVSIGAAAIGLLSVAMICAAPRCCGRNLCRMARVFRLTLSAVVSLSAVCVMVQGALLAYVAAQGILFVHALGSGASYFMDNGLASLAVRHPLLFAAVGLVAGGAVAYSLFYLKAAHDVLQPKPLPVSAVPIDSCKESQLVEFVKAIADRLHAMPPDIIVVGLEPNFYVSAYPISLPGGRCIGDGCKTLYLAGPLMQTLTIEEFSAVVGHELGHFRGEDVAYSLTFAPLYERMHAALDSMCEARGGLRILSTLAAIPLCAVVAGFLFEFAACDSSIRRERELRADEAGAQAASRAAMARALVKIILYSPQWHLARGKGTAEQVKSREVDSIMEVFIAGCARALKPLDWAEADKSLGLSSQADPFDYHPPLLERLAGLQTSLGDIAESDLVVPVAAASTLFSEWKATAESLFEAEWRVARPQNEVAGM